MINEYVIHAKVKNNLILKRILRVAKNVNEFCATHGLSATAIGNFINLKEPALLKDGGWAKAALDLADALDVLPEELFTEEQRAAQLQQNHAFIEMTRSQALAMSDPMEVMESVDLVRTLMKTARLSDKQRLVLQYRYFDDKTLEETGEQLHLTQESARRIEGEALRVLRRASDRAELIERNQRQMSVPS